MQQTAWLLDTQGVGGALSHVSQIKALVPAMAQDVVDMAIQLHGAAGLSDDHPLAAALATARALRLADGRTRSAAGVDRFRGLGAWAWWPVSNWPLRRGGRRIPSHARYLRPPLN